MKKKEEKKQVDYEHSGMFRMKEDIVKALVPKDPIDIITWASNANYCSKNLYPWEAIQLKAYYCMPFSDEEKSMIEEQVKVKNVPNNMIERNQQLRENNDSFKTLVLVEGRRSGKTFLTGIIASYEIYKLILKDNPQAFYKIDSGTIINVIIGATTSDQAKKVVFPEVSSCILTNKWFSDWILFAGENEIKFNTPYDKRIQKLYLEKEGIDRSISSVRLICANSNSSALRGKSVIALFLSEFAYFLDNDGNRSDKMVWEALEPATRDFGDDGKIVVESSPWTKSGKFYELFLESHGIILTDETEDGMKELPLKAYLKTLSFKLPTWVANPTMPRENFDDDFEKNPDYANVVWGAEFSDDIAFYLDPNKIDEMFTENLEEQSRGKKGIIYEAHGDPSETGANFPIGVAHMENDQVIFDHLHVFKASEFEDHKINYINVTQYFVELCKKFNINEFTFDQYSSIMIIQTMEEELKNSQIRTRVRKEVATPASNRKRYDLFKAALYQGRVKCFPHKLLRLELKNLTNRKGRVGCPNSGPVTTKDCADVASELTRRLIESQSNRINPFERSKNQRGTTMPVARFSKVHFG